MIAKGREEKEKRKKKGVDLTWHLKRRAELIVNASAFRYIYIYILWLTMIVDVFRRLFLKLG